MTDNALPVLTSDNAIAAMSTADLKRELAVALEVTARHLHRLASVWRELERRGEDLSHLRSGLWSYMPLIASGRLRAEIVVQYAGHASLLRRLADLPHTEQDRLLKDNTVALVEYAGGEFTERRVPITHLKAAEAAQVIGDHIRTPDEQRRVAAARSRQTRRRSGGLAGVSALAHDIGRLPGTQQVMLSVQLTEAERAALDAHAELIGVSRAKLLRATLVEAGLLTAPRGLKADDNEAAE